MGLLSWLIVGLIAGWLAGLVMKGSGYGLVGNIVIGIIGSLLGGFLASALFDIPTAMNAIDSRSVVVAFLGAIATIAIIRALPGRSPV